MLWILVVSIASSMVMGGMMVAIRFDNIDFPLPGGPITFGRANVRGAVPLAGDWNGRDVVSLDELSALFGATVDPLVLIANLPSINAAMIKSGAVTPARKAAFLATISNESGFRAMPWRTVRTGIEAAGSSD